MDSSWIYCDKDVGLLGFSITIHDHVQAWLGLDWGWMMGGFGVYLRGFASFLLDSTHVLIQKRCKLRCGRLRSGVKFDSGHGGFHVDSNLTYCVFGRSLNWIQHYYK